jgi:protein-tyrosine-phosphatase
MEIVTDQLQTLAHVGRLSTFQLLMRRYPDAVPSGEIAQALGFKANTCSVYLSALANAALVTATRDGTQIRYAIDMNSTATLMQGIFAQCCNNRPDLCLTTPQQTEGSLPVTDRIFNVLFICTGNSARSIMAETILNALGGGRFRAYSAGTAPAAAPHPRVLSLLERKGINTSSLHSKSTEVFAASDAPKMDFIFTVCDHAANEECPVWPGQPMSAHWGLADPTKATGSDSEVALAFQQAYGLLRNRISAFASLPIDTLDRISLQHAVDGIGRMTQQDQT